MIRAAATRLVVGAAAVGVGHAIYLFLYMFVWPGHFVGRVVGFTMVLLSAYVVYAVRSPRCRTASIARIGFTFEVFTCLAMSVVEYWRQPSLDEITGRISWSCLVIVLFPILVPARPRVVALVSAVAATTSPIAYAFDAWYAGHASVSAPVALSWFLPEYVSAVIAYALAGVIGGMGEDVRRARRLGSYELIERLGEGGMGEVWRARHRLLVRPAAIKLIKRDEGSAGMASRDRLARFEREAQATASLASPYTVSLYDFGISERGEFYYVMELLSGMDLDRLVKRFGPLSPSRVVHFLSQACESLEEAHRAGLVHRDIKPANLYACRIGGRCDFLKVLDFGLVRVDDTAAPAGDQLRTQEGQIKGTPAFMAPEMVTGEADVDGRADLYALGCVAYWLLTGELVFDVTTPMKMAVAHASAKPIAPSERTEIPIPPRLEQTILRCLEKDPAARPQSARELAAELEACAIEPRWSSADAEAWWLEHLPEIVDVDVARDLRQRERARLVPA
jgi:eukaryotic-like serine/threonine-protein kinase